jgi:hypothetical protein
MIEQKSNLTCAIVSQVNPLWTKKDADQLLTAALAGLRPHEPTPDDETDYQNHAT